MGSMAMTRAQPAALETLHREYADHPRSNHDRRIAQFDGRDGNGVNADRDASISAAFSKESCPAAYKRCGAERRRIPRMLRDAGILRGDAITWRLSHRFTSPRAQ